jgi:TatD DNase family protein
MIDAHCHLADPRLDGVRDELIARARARGITRFIQGGVGPEDWDRQLALAASYPKIIEPVFGLHPWWVAEKSERECDEALARLPAYLYRGAVAVGELGLDFHGRRSGTVGHALQEKVFKIQLELAKQRDLPLILHVVKAHGRALEILKAVGLPKAGGIVHSFSGELADGEAYIGLGLTLSVGGPVARKGFERTKQAVVSIPIENWVLETDSPDQPPPSHAGGLNEPVTLFEVAEAFGALKGVSPEAALERSRENLIRIFRLS